MCVQPDMQHWLATPADWQGLAAYGQNPQGQQHQQLLQRAERAARRAARAPAPRVRMLRINVQAFLQALVVSFMLWQVRSQQNPWQSC